MCVKNIFILFPIFSYMMNKQSSICLFWSKIAQTMIANFLLPEMGRLVILQFHPYILSWLYYPFAAWCAVFTIFNHTCSCVFLYRKPDPIRGKNACFPPEWTGQTFKGWGLGGHLCLFIFSRAIEGIHVFCTLSSRSTFSIVRMSRAFAYFLGLFLMMRAFMSFAHILGLLIWLCEWGGHLRTF